MSDPGGKGSDFWSRRKAAVRAEEEAERLDAEARAQADEQTRLAEKTDAEILEELGLPDPDHLTEKDEVKRFLSALVPERLRRRALRRFWGLNPALANLDGLVDYAEDYTDAATVIPNLQTVYQVGKGMFDKFAAVEEEENEAAVAQIEAPEDTPLEDVEELQCEEDIATHNDYSQKGKTSFQLTQGDSLVQSDNSDADSLDLQETALDESVKEPRKTRRRMRFDYS